MTLEFDINEFEQNPGKNYVIDASAGTGIVTIATGAVGRDATERGYAFPCGGIKTGGCRSSVSVKPGDI